MSQHYLEHQRTLQLAALERERNSFYGVGPKNVDLFLLVLFQCRDQVLVHLDPSETQWLAATCKTLWRQLGCRLIGLFYNQSIMPVLIRKLLQKRHVAALSCTCKALKQRLEPYRPDYRRLSWFAFSLNDIYPNLMSTFPYCNLSLLESRKSNWHLLDLAPVGHPRQRIAAYEARLARIDNELEAISKEKRRLVKQFCKKPKACWPVAQPIAKISRQRSKHKRSHR